MSNLILVQYNSLSTLEVKQLIEKYKSKKKTPSSFLLYKNRNILYPSEAKMKYEHETNDCLLKPLDICNKNVLIAPNEILNDKCHMSNWSEFPTLSKTYVQGINQFESDVNRNILFDPNDAMFYIDEASSLFEPSRMEISFLSSEELMFYDNYYKYFNIN
ncbi:hypothetical protein F8M41_007593 [Gigaspora margarita]|uniref:Uncharacterized protein n=1 Tax=Gigaspora margarita TaxID=4874 RepID=A0A8H4AWB3_GIGMA|nr:hypothetical protein F8M41_007593 [Gigaspora margarita]